jgi:hypothetical protein
VVERAPVGTCGTPLPLGGYTLITANDFDEAVELAKACPILEERERSKLASSPGGVSPVAAVANLRPPAQQHRHAVGVVGLLPCASGAPLLLSGAAALADRNISQLADACQAGAAARWGVSLTTGRSAAAPWRQERRPTPSRCAPCGRNPRETDRIAKHRSRPAAWKQAPLPLDGRDPDIVKAHQLARNPGSRGLADGSPAAAGMTRLGAPDMRIHASSLAPRAG